MKKLTKPVGYISPETTLTDIVPMSVLCQSGESNTSLEDMTENDYTFTF